MGRYHTPPGDGAEPVAALFAEQRRVARDAGRPSGTNIAQLVEQVRAALQNITATVISATNSFLSSGTVSMANLDASGSVNVAGPIYSPHGRANPVTTGYVGAWLNADGRIGASVSAARFKQDFESADTDGLVDALLRVGLLRFRYTAAVDQMGDAAPLELGAIAEYFQQTALREYVFFDADGQVLGINYERLTIPLIAVVQSLDARLKSTDAQVAELTRRLDELVG